MQWLADREILFSGGWTQVLHITSDTNDVNKLKQIEKVSTLTGFNASGNYGMKTAALADLRKITRFQQLRFRCKTQIHHPRLLNIKTLLNALGTAVVESFCSATSDYPASCGSYQVYGDNNSNLGQDCSAWKDGEWHPLDNNEKLFSHPMWADSRTHWNLLTKAKRFECDDPQISATIRTGDFWEVYAR